MQAAVFAGSDVYCVRPPTKCQVQLQIHTRRPVYPDYLSVSYDYGVNGSRESLKIISGKYY